MGNQACCGTPDYQRGKPQSAFRKDNIQILNQNQKQKQEEHKESPNQSPEIQESKIQMNKSNISQPQIMLTPTNQAIMHSHNSAREFSKPNISFIMQNNASNQNLFEKQNSYILQASEELPNKINVSHYDIYSQKEQNNYSKIFTKIENVKMQNQQNKSDTQSIKIAKQGCTSDNKSQQLKQIDTPDLSRISSNNLILKEQFQSEDEYVFNTQNRALSENKSIHVSSSNILRVQDTSSKKYSKAFIQQCVQLLEFIKLELALILPQIKEAALLVINKYGNDDKKLKKKQKNLIKLVNSTKDEILSEYLDPSVGFQFDSIKKFEKILKKDKVHLENQCPQIFMYLDQIENATNCALGKQYDDQGFKDINCEVALLQIQLDDENVSRDLYKRILSKFYSLTRYEMYQKIQQFWQSNKNKITANQSKKFDNKQISNDEENKDENPLNDETILKLAGEINTKNIQRQVLDLYKIDYSNHGDPILAMRKLKYIFEQKEPINQDFNIYIDCFTEAHNQMLQYIYDPRNKYRIMEENPIHSLDLMYGVPNLFQNILEEITLEIDIQKNNLGTAQFNEIYDDFQVDQNEDQDKRLKQTSPGNEQRNQMRRSTIQTCIPAYKPLFLQQKNDQQNLLDHNQMVSEKSSSNFYQQNQPAQSNQDSKLSDEEESEINFQMMFDQFNKQNDGLINEKEKDLSSLRIQTGQRASLRNYLQTTTNSQRQKSFINKKKWTQAFGLTNSILSPFSNHDENLYSSQYKKQRLTINQQIFENNIEKNIEQDNEYLKDDQNKQQNQNVFRSNDEEVVRDILDSDFEED